MDAIINELIIHSKEGKKRFHLSEKNLGKNAQMHHKNYKTSMGETKEDLNQCGDMPCIWIKRVNITRIQTFPKSN